MSLCLALFGPRAEAGGHSITNDEDFFEMSIEELMELDVVVSGSRRTQKIRDLTVPVTVVSAEAIHRSGLTTIPEILQFAIGVDVLKFDRNRYAVGVRGLHDFTSDRTLTLINGRIADSALFGGSEFFRLPLLVEDIDRIEIVRGPGGAAWGANAFAGVINIITKNPEDVQGHFASATVNEFGDAYTHLRWADRCGRWSWRVSAGYEEKESSDDAGAGGLVSSGTPVVNALIGFDAFEADDFSEDWRFDIEAIYASAEDTELSFGAAYAQDTMGTFEFGGFLPSEDTRLQTFRSFARADHSFGGGTTGYVQWFANAADSKMPSIAEWSTIENDLEFQVNTECMETHSVSVGGNVRFIRVDTASADAQQIQLQDEPYDEQLAGLFLVDRWQVCERLTLEGQVRGDWYSETQGDWSARASACQALDAEKQHVLRVSAARAFRTPLASLRRTTTSRIAIGGGLFGFNVREPDDLKNEETWSLESGYAGELGRGLRVLANMYYQRFEKMIGYTTLDDPLGLDRAIYQASNIDGADSYGGELEIQKRGECGSCSAWYAWHGFSRDEPEQNLRAYGPAANTVGLSGVVLLPHGCSLNMNYRYTDSTEPFASTLTVVERSHRLDLAVTQEFAQGDGELTVGVHDVLDEAAAPTYGMGQLTAHETPGRTFFVRLGYHF